MCKEVFLIYIGMGLDKLGLISACLLYSNTTNNLLHCFPFCLIADGIKSKISLVHPDDANWYLMLNKTHHG